MIGSPRVQGCRDGANRGSGVSERWWRGRPAAVPCPTISSGRASFAVTPAATRIRSSHARLRRRLAGSFLDELERSRRAQSAQDGRRRRVRAGLRLGQREGQRRLVLVIGRLEVGAFADQIGNEAVGPGVRGRMQRRVPIVVGRIDVLLQFLEAVAKVDRGLKSVEGPLGEAALHQPGEGARNLWLQRVHRLRRIAQDR